MTIKYKTLKYKHQREARELNEKIKAKNATPDEISLFVISLVESWDFMDVETGELLPLDNPKLALDEMSLEQFAEMNTLFNNAMEVGVAAVPKANNGQSPSGLIKSKQARKPK